MTQFLRWLRKPAVHNFFVAIFVVSSLSFVAGCAGTVVGDAENVLTVIGLAVSTLSGVLAFVPGGAAFAGALNAAGTTITSLESVFAQYKANASETLYQQIEDFVALLQANLQKLVNPEGVPSAVVSKVNSIVSVVITQITAWLSLITQLKSSAPAAAAAHEAHEAPHEIKAVKPASAKELHSQLKTIVETPTGDATTDFAFTVANRF